MTNMEQASMHVISAMRHFDKALKDYAIKQAEQTLKEAILPNGKYPIGEIYPDLKVIDINDEAVTVSIHNDQPKPLVYEFPIVK